MSDEVRPISEEELRHKPLSKEDAYFKKLEEERQRVLAKKATSKRLCPIDSTPLVEENFHGLVIDRCPTCRGMWLDEHEGELFAKAMEAEADDKESTFQRWMKNILPYQK